MKAEGIDQKDPRYMHLLKILKVQSAYHNLAPMPNTSFGSSQQNPPNDINHVVPSSQSSTPSKPTPPGQLTSYQLFQLKAQILAYKYLSRNLPLPPKLLNAIRTFSTRATQNLQQRQQEAARTQQALNIGIALAPTSSSSASQTTKPIPSTMASSQTATTVSQSAPQSMPIPVKQVKNFFQ
jgi:hypothetical protein